MSWPIVKLDELVAINIGRTPSRDRPDYWGVGSPWLSIRDMNQGRVLFATSEEITPLAITESKIRLAKKGSLLFSFKLSIGKVGIAGRDMYHNEAIVSLPIKDKETLYGEYLYYALQQLNFSSETDRAVMGATLNKKKLAELKIPLPPLETQKQIAAILGKADQLRKDCQQMEQELNNLAQSVFMDMFGDPVSNPKGWTERRLKEVSTVVTGNTPSREKKHFYGNDIEWIKSDNINTPSHLLTQAKEYLSHAGLKVARTAPVGSILITCIAGSPDCIGNVAIADRMVSFNQQINAVIPKENILLSEFFYVLCLVAKRKIQSASTNSMKGMISKGKLEEIIFPIPPIEEQEKYRCAFTSIQIIAEWRLNMKKQIDDSFGSLVMKAFTGQLTTKTKAA